PTLGSTGSTRGRRSATMAVAGDILAEAGGDLGGEGPTGGRLDAAGPGDVDGELGRHPAGPAREQDDAVGQAGRLPHVVGDEHHGGTGALPDALHLVVEDVTGHGVESAEGLVHE